MKKRKSEGPTPPLPVREGEVNTEKRNRRSTPEGAKVKSASKREQRKCIYSAEREQVQDDGVGLNLRVSESMVGTRHAVSDNKA